MSEEKRLSLSFGNFSFEIVGYDEPFTIMAKVFDLVIKTSKEAPWLIGDNIADAGSGRRRFAAALNENARTFDLDIAEIDGRFVVTPPESQEKKENAPRAADAKPASRSPLHLSIAADPAPTEASTEATESAVAAKNAEADADSAAIAEDPAPVENHERGSETVEDDFVEEIVEATSVVAPSAPATATDESASSVAEAEVSPTTAEEPSVADSEPVAEDAALKNIEAEAKEGASAEIADAPEDNAEDPAEEAEPAPEPVIASRPAPKIVIDRAKSQPHQRRKPQPMHKISATVTRTKEETAEASESVEAAEPFVLTSEFSAPKRHFAVKHVEEDDDENFLFASDDVAHAQDASADPAPLALSGDDRIDEPKSAARKKRRGPLGLGIFRRRKDDDGDETEVAAADHDEDSAFDRLRETAEAQLPKLEEPTLELSRNAPERALFAISDGKDLDDAASPAVFARHMGAQSLQDLLEASAAYVSIVDGKAKFSRRDVMLALNDIGLDKEYTPEARLKSFRKLLTSGAIVRAEDGMFAISHATRFGYETQLRSNA